jgi:hypothetical protein
MTNPPIDLDHNGKTGRMKLADMVKEARGWEGEEAGFKAGIESDDKVSDASVRWMGSFSGRSCG